MGQKVTKIKRGDGDPLVTRSRSDRNLASTPPAKEKPTDMPERAEGRIDLYSILSNNVVVMNLMQFLLPADLASLMVLSKSAFLYLSPPGETTLQSYRKIAAPKCLKCFGEVWRCDGFAVIAALYKNQPTGHYIHIVGDHACESETSGPNHGESRYIGITSTSADVFTTCAPAATTLESSSFWTSRSFLHALAMATILDHTNSPAGVTSALNVGNWKTI